MEECNKCTPSNGGQTMIENYLDQLKHDGN
jgi:hypothetical protein